MAKDPYAVLQISRDATFDEVRAAYRRLAQATHPDRNPSPDATQRFIEVHSAWLELRDNAALKARSKSATRPRPSVRSNPRSDPERSRRAAPAKTPRPNARLILAHERAALEVGAIPPRSIAVRPSLSGLIWPLVLPASCFAIARLTGPTTIAITDPRELGSMVINSIGGLLLLWLLPSLIAAMRGKLAIWVGPGGVHEVRGSHVRSMPHSEIRAIEFGYDPIGRLGFHPFYLEFLLGPDARPFRVRRPYGARELRRVIDLVLQQDAGTS